MFPLVSARMGHCRDRSPVSPNSGFERSLLPVSWSAPGRLAGGACLGMAIGLGTHPPFAFRSPPAKYPPCLRWRPVQTMY